MKRVSIDFKGPLPTASRNSYLLTVVDEYSRFPSAFSMYEHAHSNCDQMPGADF